jgi:hypothetical protein
MFNYSSSFTIQRNIHGISQTPVLIAASKAAGGFKDVMCSPLQRLSQSQIPGHRESEMLIHKRCGKVPLMGEDNGT